MSEPHDENASAEEPTNTTGPAIGDSVPDGKRQSYIRQVMEDFGLEGASNAVYDSTPDSRYKKYADDPAFTVGYEGGNLNPVVHVNAVAFRYSADELGSFLFHESMHVEQYERYKYFQYTHNT